MSPLGGFQGPSVLAVVHYRSWPLLFALAILTSFACSVTDADIVNWQTGEVIAGTEGVDPGPGINLTRQDLRFAKLSQVDLTGADFGYATLTNADLSQANLIYAYFGDATLTNVDLSFSDLRGACAIEAANASNTIMHDGLVNGLDLAETQRLVVRDHELPLRVEQSMALTDFATLELRFEDATWRSTVMVQTGVNPGLGGTLALHMDPEANIHDLVGLTFKLFD